MNGANCAFAALTLVLLAGHSIYSLFSAKDRVQRTKK